MNASLNPKSAKWPCASTNPQSGDDPQSLLYLTGRYLEHLRVRNFSDQTLYGRAKYLRYFRVFCEQLGLTQARQVTRAIILNYQSYLFTTARKTAWR